MQIVNRFDSRIHHYYNIIIVEKSNIKGSEFFHGGSYVKHLLSIALRLNTLKIIILCYSIAETTVCVRRCVPPENAPRSAGHVQRTSQTKSDFRPNRIIIIVYNEPPHIKAEAHRHRYLEYNQLSKQQMTQ